jgi:hypothetical protein
MQMRWKAVPVGLQRHRRRERGLWNTRTQRHMRAACIVMAHPCMQEATQVGLSERDQKVQALPPERPQQSLTEGIRLGTSHGGFKGSHPQVAYTPVELLREDRIAVMNEEMVRVIRWDCLAQLLERSLSRGMRGRVGMQNPTSRVFHDHKDVEKPKGRRHHQAEIAGDDRLHMIADKRPPVLG